MTGAGHFIRSPAQLRHRGQLRCFAWCDPQRVRPVGLAAPGGRPRELHDPGEEGKGQAGPRRHLSLYSLLGCTVPASEWPQAWLQHTRHGVAPDRRCPLVPSRPFHPGSLPCSMEQTPTRSAELEKTASLRTYLIFSEIDCENSK